MPERLWTIQETADHLQVSVKTLYDWRYRGIGPPGIKVGGLVRYRPENIEQWLDAIADTPVRAELRYHKGVFIRKQHRTS